MTNRSFQDPTYQQYRWGFNGKEDDEDGGFQDYGMRGYDDKSCTFWSVDPITAKYPELSPYQFASRSPIWAIDLDGLEAIVATYGIKQKEDDNFVKICGSACAKILGVQPQGINSGKSLLSVLRSESKFGRTISAWVNYGHSSRHGLFFENDKGFYKGTHTTYHGEDANFEDLITLSSTGQVKFSKHSLFIFASCNTATGEDENKGKYSEDSFAATIGDAISKDYMRFASDIFSETIKVTTIGATNYSNIQMDGTIITDGTFVMTEKVYKVEKVFEIITEHDFSTRSTMHTMKMVDMRVRIMQTKTTNLGNKIDPAKIVKEHDDQNVEIH